MKKKIIFVQFVKFLDFHYNLFEIKHLKKYYKVDTHDLSAVFNKNSHSNYGYLKQKKKITKFYSFSDWYNEILRQKKKFKGKIFLIYTGNPLNFSFLKFYLLILIKKIPIGFLVQNSFPRLDIYKKYSKLENLIYKIHRVINRRNHVIYDFKVRLINRFINIISQFFYPKFIFTTGKINLDDLKKKYNRSKIISLNSWDASKTFFKSKNKKFTNRKYGVYLTPFSLKSASDSNFYKYKKLEDSKKVFHQVNKGLQKIEKSLNYKVLIGLHPRSEEMRRFKLLNNRPAYKFKTLEIVKNSQFVITHMSVAVSYAILYYKPLLFIYTDEHKKNLYYMRYQQEMANFFSCQSSHIDNINNFKFANKVTKKIKKRYDHFKDNYLLSSQFNKIPNYKILKKFV